MKKLYIPVLSLMTMSLLSAGCARISSDAGVLVGMGVNDLNSGKAVQVSKVYSISEAAAYDKALSIIDTTGLRILQQNRREGFIVAIGFPRQTDTTRVGIFFSEEGQDTTRVTLGSRSSSALTRAEGMIFGGFSGDTVLTD